MTPGAIPYVLHRILILGIAPDPNPYEAPKMILDFSLILIIKMILIQWLVKF